MPTCRQQPDDLQEISLLPETASDSAVRFLRAMIFSGELGPGDKLPPERDLGARLGISRMTLRLALKALESTGYIVTTRGSHGGSRVADADSLIRCWNQWMSLHAQELADIFEFRTTVEARLAALAAERRTEEDLRAMQRAVAKERRPQDWSSLFRVDVDIHRSIARAARSPRLERAMLSSREDFFAPVNLAHFEEREHQVHASHNAILEAIRRRDAAAAEEEMRRHILVIRMLTDKALKAAGIALPPALLSSPR
ncbi:MAG: FadR family transcriptional regulator [Actinobacteria bacterium]|jgi:DNA-binding FadR family transcriptional regulator|nr:FadR family transcriptional regulator [Actinomycetota bacterium]